MLEKIIQRADQAGTRLSQSLSAFEKISMDIKEKMSDELISFEKNSAQKIESLNNNLKDSIGNLEESSFKITENMAAQINVLKREAGQIVEDNNEKMREVLTQHVTTLTTLINDNLTIFSKLVKERYECLYSEYEVAAKNRADKAFETDIEILFKKNSDRLAPMILKALWRYIFRFKWFKSKSV